MLRKMPKMGILINLCYSACYVLLNFGGVFLCLQGGPFGVATGRSLHPNGVLVVKQRHAYCDLGRASLLVLSDFGFVQNDFFMSDFALFWKSRECDFVKEVLHNKNY